jgi:hypothetical protein
MSPDFVRNSVRRRPFRPFIIHLAGGRSIPVPSPECIILPPEGRLVLVEVLSQPQPRVHVIDLLLVSDLEFPNASILD